MAGSAVSPREARSPQRRGPARSALDAVGHDARAVMGRVAATPHPALAAGGLAAGLTGGALAGLRLARRGRLADLVPRRARPASPALGALLTAGRETGRLAQRAGGIESDLRAIRRALDEPRRASPIEVVLQGLTRRPEKTKERIR